MRAAQNEDSGLEREAERSAKDNELKVSTPEKEKQTREGVSAKCHAGHETVLV